MSEEQTVLTKAQRREIPLPLTAEQRTFAEQIIMELNEENPQAWRQIEALVYYCGIEMTKAVFDETLKIESEGGLMVSSGSRRRTPGGVFLHLMASRVSQDIRREAIYLYQDKKEANKKKKKQQKEGNMPVDVQPRVKAAAPLWDVYYEYFDELSAERGAATTVKITLIGRPGAVKINQETVTTTVEHVVKTSSLPKGVPLPPKTPTTYTVYIGLKQWRKVEAALSENADDAMIIEGVCAFDPQVQGMVVFATNATSKGLEAAKRGAQSAKAPKEAPAPLSIPTVVADPNKYPVPPNVPPSVAQKLQDLYSAAEQFRNKLALLDAQPPDQRLGYAMTQKLLKNTEDQINALESQYK